MYIPSLIMSTQYYNAVKAKSSYPVLPVYIDVMNFHMPSKFFPIDTLPNNLNRALLPAF